MFYVYGIKFRVFLCRDFIGPSEDFKRYTNTNNRIKYVKSAFVRQKEPKLTPYSEKSKYFCSQQL